MDSQGTQQSPSGGSAIALMAWVEVNKKRLLIGGAIALLVILAISLFVQQQGQKERSASRAFSEVKLPLNPATPAPGSADALLKVASDYPGTKAAVRAVLTSGGLLFSEKKYTEAEALFTRVIHDYPDSPWIPEAQFGIAAALEAQGKTAEATTKYEDIRRRYDKSPVIDDAKFALARLYEPQKPEDAYKLYDDLTKSMGGSHLAMQASARQAELLKARPELARLKESLMPPTTPPIPSPAIQLTNAIRAATSNLPTIRLTNGPTATSTPIPIKLSPNPTPSPSPAPAPPNSAPAPTAPAPAK